MDKRKRSRQPTGRPRGRPRKTPATPNTTTTAGDVDGMIAAASAPGQKPADAAASLDELARDVEREKADEKARTADAPPLTGEIHNADGSRAGAGADDPAATPWGKQKSREIAFYVVMLFAAIAAVGGDAWVVTLEEAQPVSDATVRAYADDLAQLEEEYRAAGPLTALVVLLFAKWVASRQAKQPAADVAERLPGTAPANA